MFVTWVISRFELKSGEEFWVTSQFYLIPTESAGAMGRSESIPGDRFNSTRLWLSHELTRISSSGRHSSRKLKKGHAKKHLSRKPQKGHTKSNAMERRPNYKVIGVQNIHWIQNIIESWADSNQYSRSFWVVSRFESKFWRAFWAMSRFE